MRERERERLRVRICVSARDWFCGLGAGCGVRVCTSRSDLRRYERRWRGGPAIRASCPTVGRGRAGKCKGACCRWTGPATSVCGAERAVVIDVWPHDLCDGLRRRAVAVWARERGAGEWKALSEKYCIRRCPLSVRLSLSCGGSWLPPGLIQ